MPKLSDINGLVNNIKESKDLYYISLLVINSMIGKNSILPELVLLMDEKSLSNFLYYFSGETITLPTLDQFRDLLSGILIYYYYDIKGMKWSHAVEKIYNKYTDESSYKLNKAREDILKALKDIKLVGNPNES